DRTPPPRARARPHSGPPPRRLAEGRRARMTFAGAPHDSEAGLAATCRLVNRRPKGIRVDRRVSIQVRRDVLKVRAQPGSIAQAAVEHFADGLDVLVWAHA